MAAINMYSKLFCFAIDLAAKGVLKFEGSPHLLDSDILDKELFKLMGVPMSIKIEPSDIVRFNNLVKAGIIDASWVTLPNAPLLFKIKAIRSGTFNEGRDISLPAEAEQG